MISIPSIIIFEDSDFMVVNKPAGITVNRSDTTRLEETLQDWVEKKFKVQTSNFKVVEELVDEESDFFKRAGIVHRLDKETSGLLIIAKNQQAFERLQQEFKERRVKKTYTALVHGRVEQDEGEVRVPVGRLPWNRHRFGVLTGGREAATKYKTVANYRSPVGNEVLTLLTLTPQTGRTHQIRVHMKYAGHPLFSDELYAGRKTARNDRLFLSRLFLHASQLEFLHPVTGKVVKVATDLPEDLSSFLMNLQTV